MIIRPCDTTHFVVPPALGCVISRSHRGRCSTRNTLPSFPLSGPFKVPRLLEHYLHRSRCGPLYCRQAISSLGRAHCRFCGMRSVRGLFQCGITFLSLWVSPAFVCNGWHGVGIAVRGSSFEGTAVFRATVWVYL